MIGQVTRIVNDEGFTVHPEKTRVARQGARQKVTGLVVNDQHPPRVPRKVRRQLRAAIHRLKLGQPLQEGESLETLKGYAAFVHMSQPELGEKLLKQLQPFASPAVASP